MCGVAYLSCMGYVYYVGGCGLSCGCVGHVVVCVSCVIVVVG